MALKGIIIGAIIVILLISTSTSTAFASVSRELSEKERESGFYTESGSPKYNKDRPAINPDFDPDKSCLFDILQDKCDPGTEGECPEGFGQNSDNRCVPRTFVDGEWKWICPEGYHSAYEDESGQCYPNDEGCQDKGFFLVEREGEDRNDICAPPYAICDEEEFRNEDFCKVS